MAALFFLFESWEIPSDDDYNFIVEIVVEMRSERLIV